MARRACSSSSWMRTPPSSGSGARPSSPHRCRPCWCSTASTLRSCTTSAAASWRRSRREAEQQILSRRPRGAEPSPIRTSKEEPRMSIELFDLRGKNALITGGTHGIGMAVAVALGKAGARVCVNDISDDKLEACRVQYAQHGIKVYTLKFDVTSAQDVDRGIAQIERDVAPVDILVNNAGIIKRVPILEMAIEDFKQVLDIDLVAPLIVARRVVPSMIARRGGKIINMCSLLSVYARYSVSA